MLLAKISDRPARECQPLRYWPRRQSSATSSLRLAYLEIPDVRQSWAHLGGSPYLVLGARARTNTAFRIAQAALTDEETTNKDDE
jgi:hypothetical protein